MTISQTAHDFFDACETGKGWDVCKMFCHESATFTCQADTLADVNSIADYADWMKGLLGPIPDGAYELKAFATDEEHGAVVAAAVFRGTHSGEGGPVPPTGNTVSADYVYVMDFDGPKIRHMTKIWNDGYTLRSLGWG
jgi:predicted ester cyclase